MRKLLLMCLTVFTLCLISCYHPENKKINIAIMELSKSGFDRNYWLSDTLGCDAEKKTTYALLLREKNTLIGFSESEVIEILGKPFGIKKNLGGTRFFYVIDGRLMCDNLKFKKVFKSGENSYLVLYFDIKNQMFQMTTIIP